MEEIKEGVIAETPPAEEVVEPQKEQVAEETEVVETPTQEVKPEVIKDDRPIENVAWEVKRKLDETIPSLQNEIRELKTFIEQSRQPQQPTYSKAQLQAYASDPSTTTEQRLWAYTEVEKLEKTERQKEYETLVTSTRRQTETEGKKAQAAQWVAQTFPETVVKDMTGNVQGWNNASPVLMKANEYMSRNANLRNDPEGFMAAVKMAAWDLGISPTSNKKIDRTVAQLRKEQKKQLASSGGTRIAESPESASKARIAKLQQEYAKTGDSNLFAEIVKLRGLNPYV